MAIQVSMPKLGLLMSEGTIVAWLVENGQVVKPDQPIVHIITNKINYEVTAPAGGVLCLPSNENYRPWSNVPVRLPRLSTEPGRPNLFGLRRGRGCWPGNITSTWAMSLRLAPAVMWWAQMCCGLTANDARPNRLPPRLLLSRQTT